MRRASFRRKSLSLQICHLSDLLEHFAQVEDITGYDCDCCHRQPNSALPSAKRSMSVVKLPNVLRLHIKRFRCAPPITVQPLPQSPPCHTPPITVLPLPQSPPCHTPPITVLPLPQSPPCHTPPITVLPLPQSPPCHTPPITVLLLPQSPPCHTPPITVLPLPHPSHHCPPPPPPPIGGQAARTPRLHNTSSSHLN